MLSSDLFTIINYYTDKSTIKLLNKDTSNKITLSEKSVKWKKIYLKFLRTHGLRKIGLNGNYNWKQEYLIISKFNDLDKIKKINREESIDINFNFGELRHIPKECGNMINLRRANFCCNKIIKMPKEFGNLINLRYLSFDSNKLTKIPRELGNLINLECLSVYGNKIT